MSELARQLIAENKRTKATFLDLGNCGLTELPAEIGELVWLEGLSFARAIISLADQNLLGGQMAAIGAPSGRS